MANNFFSFNRFTMLFAKHTQEHYKAYLMSLGVISGILTLLFAFIAYNNNGVIGQVSQLILFSTFLLIAGAIFTSMIFADLGDKKKAIQTLMLPASYVEKFLVSWIYSLIIFLICFIGAFYLVVFIVSSIWGNPESKLMDLFSEDLKPYRIIGFYIILHSITLIGAIYFERLHFVKTGFVFFVFLVLLSILNQFITYFLFDGKFSKAVPFIGLQVIEGENSWPIRLNENADMLTSLMFFTVAIVFWICALFKLKEKEI
ncbi:hypothetical protein GS399_10940 [Pedobacter sp. HMF7647]|uniref:Uncharacterized protein n=1 Tax=Hufsiella arboris TaxID=2695275 RepID=A0A7K1YA84_9SPHI|nr:hypothetical protein [Hufsiella arboris]MXV51486.1 hypothetical protein [Hufsiella arboris]